MGRSIYYLSGIGVRNIFPKVTVDNVVGWVFDTCAAGYILEDRVINLTIVAA